MKSEWKRLTVKKKCLQCENEFFQYTETQLYCMPSCKQKAWRKRKLVDNK